MEHKGATLLSGREAAEKIEETIKSEILSLKGRPPTLAVIQVGEHAPSQIYVKRKEEACKRAHIISKILKFNSDISEKALIEEIIALNNDREVDGILVQLPLPSQIDVNKIILTIDPNKDVDGFHPINVGKLLLGQTDGFISCTPLGIKQLLDHYQIDLKGKSVLIAGRSNIVGKPLSALLMQNGEGLNATVTIANSFTKDLDKKIAESDVVVAAMGKPLFIKGDWIKKGAIVVDVGISRVEGKIVGDVEFDIAKLRASYITPVPGGVGPMTISALLSNTLKSRKRL
jgi:methylenetetrahydrofolate dehydrogenase (NADP+)/methenyltetrahydrofolate cyclohydrolase